MQTGLDIVGLAQQIAANKAAKKDYIVDTSAATLVPTDGDFGLQFGDGIVGVNKTAHDQIRDRLGIPAKYYDRMKTEAPDLLAENVNTWFTRAPERRLVRTLDGRGRAFLSDRFQRIDNDEIAEVALPVLLAGGLEIVSSNVTEHRLYIQAVSPRLRADVKVGDEVQGGVILSNSEIGHGAASVTGLMRRLRCLNGMVSDDIFRAYHVGKRIEDNEALWADDTRKADDIVVLKKIRDMINAVLDEGRFQQRILKLQGLTEPQITGKVQKVVELVSEKIGANEAEQESILSALIKGGDLSAWGVVNAVTAQAHDASNYDRSVEFEVAGGKLVELAPTDWKRLLEAA